VLFFLEEIEEALADLGGCHGRSFGKERGVMPWERSRVRCACRDGKGTKMREGWGRCKASRMRDFNGVRRSLWGGLGGQQGFELFGPFAGVGVGEVFLDQGEHPHGGGALVAVGE